MRTLINTCTSYMFANKDPAIYKIRTALADRGMSYSDVEKSGGPRAATVRNWDTGPTRRPQHATLEAAARAAGKTWALVDINPRQKMEYDRRTVAAKRRTNGKHTNGKHK